MTTYFVNANGGAGNGTSTFSNLEAAVEAADAHGGVDTIQLAPGTILLEDPSSSAKDGQVFIDDSVNIVGAGNTSVSAFLAGGSSGSTITTDTSIFDAQNDPGAAIITVGAGVTANFSQFNLNGGDVASGTSTANSGVQAATGILFNGGAGTVDHVSIGNVGADVEAEPRGAGINVFGATGGSTDPVTITNSDFAQNERRDIGVFDGRVVNIDHSNFQGLFVDDDTSPGQSIEYGVQVDGATANITNSTFSGFDATQAGSGVVFGSAAIIEGSSDPSALPASNVSVSGSTFTDDSVAVALGFQPNDTSSFTFNGPDTVNSSLTGALAVDANGDVVINGATPNLSGTATTINYNGFDDANTVAGGPGNDHLSGDGNGDTFQGNGGNDDITGGGGTDTAVFRGNASEYNVNNLGNGDFVVTDSVAGRDGTDTLHSIENLSFNGTTFQSGSFGTSGNDTFTGTTGDDAFFGGSGNDNISGGSGNDNLDGGTGQDIVTGGTGDDAVNGGDGADRVDGSSGDDIVLGGAGDDSAFGGTGDDFVSGQDGNDLVNGESGNDTVDGGSGNDVVLAGTGDDAAFGGEGDDYVNGQDGNDLVNGEGGNDTVVGGSGDDIVLGGAGNDSAFGGTGNDFVNGQAGNDRVFGEEGNDFLSGGAGNDRLDGGVGNDRMFGDAGDDTFVFTRGSGMDRIGDFAPGGAEDHVELSGFTGVSTFNDVFSRATDTSEGTLITFDTTNSLLLEHVTRSQLTSDDFTFA